MDDRDRKDEIEEYVDEAIDDWDEDEDVSEADKARMKSAARRKLEEQDRQDRKKVLADFQRSTFSRRDFLKLLGITAVGGIASSVGLSYFVKNDLIGKTHPSGMYASVSNTVDIVEAGADNTGGEVIDEVLESVAEENTRIKFPAGTYLMDKISSQIRNLQFVGDDATIVPTDRSSLDTLMKLTGEGSVVDGFTYDVTECQYPPQIQVIAPSWTFTNFRIKGKMKSPGDSRHAGVSAFKLGVTSESGEGRFENVYLHEGAAEGGESDNRRGILANMPENVGHLFLNKVWMEYWAENTIYAVGNPGPMTIQNSFFRNTNIGLRVGGQTRVRNCVMVKDGSIPVAAWSGGSRMRGVLVQAYDRSSAGKVVIEDCDISISEDGSAGSPIAATDKLPEDGLEVKNTRIFSVSSRWPPIRISNDLSKLTLDNVHITGPNVDSRAGIYLHSGNRVSSFGELSGCVDVPSRVSNISEVQNSPDITTGSCKQPTLKSPLKAPKNYDRAFGGANNGNGIGLGDC